MPLATQCDLLGLNRSRWYDRPAEPSALNLELMRRLDEEYTAHPFYGSRRMTAVMRRAGHAVNRKRVLRERPRRRQLQTLPERVNQLIAQCRAMEMSHV